MPQTVSKFRSKLGIHYLSPFVIFFLLSITFTVCSGHWFIIPIVGAPLGSLLATYFSTSYSLQNTSTLVVVGPRVKNKQKIDVSKIESVKRIHNSQIAPALSRDRLELTYNQTEKIYLSPVKEELFISKLKEINPDIILK